MNILKIKYTYIIMDLLEPLYRFQNPTSLPSRYQNISFSKNIISILRYLEAKITAILSVSIL